MHRFILTRLLQAIPVLFIIALLTFFMVRLAPGTSKNTCQKLPSNSCCRMVAPI